MALPAGEAQEKAAEAVAAVATAAVGDEKREPPPAVVVVATGDGMEREEQAAIEAVAGDEPVTAPIAEKAEADGREAAKDYNNAAAGDVAGEATGVKGLTLVADPATAVATMDAAASDTPPASARSATSDGSEARRGRRGFLGMIAQSFKRSSSGLSRSTSDATSTASPLAPRAETKTDRDGEAEKRTNVAAVVVEEAKEPPSPSEEAAAADDGQIIAPELSLAALCTSVAVNDTPTEKEGAKYEESNKPCATENQDVEMPKKKDVEDIDLVPGAAPADASTPPKAESDGQQKQEGETAEPKMQNGDVPAATAAAVAEIQVEHQEANDDVNAADAPSPDDPPSTAPAAQNKQPKSKIWSLLSRKGLKKKDEGGGDGDGAQDPAPANEKKQQQGQLKGSRRRGKAKADTNEDSDGKRTDAAEEAANSAEAPETKATGVNGDDPGGADAPETKATVVNGDVPGGANAQRPEEENKETAEENSEKFPPLRSVSSHPVDFSQMGRTSLEVERPRPPAENKMAEEQPNGTDQPGNTDADKSQGAAAAAATVAAAEPAPQAAERSEEEKAAATDQQTDGPNEPPEGVTSDGKQLMEDQQPEQLGSSIGDDFSLMSGVTSHFARELRVSMEVQRSDKPTDGTGPAAMSPMKTDIPDELTKVETAVPLSEFVEQDQHTKGGADKPRKSGWIAFQKMFSFGQVKETKGSSDEVGKKAAGGDERAAADGAANGQQDAESEPVWGVDLTKTRVRAINDDLKAFLARANLDPEKYFARPLEEFRSPVDFYDDVASKVKADNQSVDVVGNLAAKLGDDQLLVLGLKNKEAFGIATQIDDEIKKAFEDHKDKIDKAFAKFPEEFSSPVDYYSQIQESGIDVLPSIKEHLGNEHPVVTSLAGESKEKPGWDVMKTNQKSPELPVSEGGVIGEESVDIKQQFLATDEKKGEKGVDGATEKNDGATGDAENKPAAANVKDTAPTDGATAGKGVTRDEAANTGRLCNCFCLGARAAS